MLLNINFSFICCGLSVISISSYGPNSLEWFFEQSLLQISAKRLEIDEQSVYRLHIKFVGELSNETFNILHAFPKFPNRQFKIHQAA